MKGNRGVISVEASISLTIFIFAFLCITSLTTLVRAESKIQYALNQAAKEFSQYTYIMYRAGIYDTSNQPQTKTVDELIQETSDFTNMLKSKSSEYSSSSPISSGSMLDEFQQIGEDAESIVTAGKSLYQKYKGAMSDPTAIINELYEVFKNEAKDTVVSKVAGSLACQLLMPKYLGDDPDAYLKGIGIKNGINGLNFSLSNVLEDGKTINFTVVYTINYDIPLIGERKMTIKQTASTASWDARKKLSDISVNVWNESPLKRGQKIVEEIRKQNSALAVDKKKNTGFDLYDMNTNTFTGIVSLDTSTATYITSSNGKTVLNKNSYINKLRQELNKLNKSVEDIESVFMDSGQEIAIDSSIEKKVVLNVYIPQDSQFKEEAQNYANELAKEYKNVTIKVSYFK